MFRWEDANDRLGTRIARIDPEGGERRVQFLKAGTTHSQWVQSLVNSKDPRDVAFAKEMLGPTRFNLVQSGKLTVDRLYYSGKLRTIDELKELTK